ncbi:MAG: hypothetical protein KAR87_03785 [Candidatus Aenigmarchaeota archaeon]|nr:hypothetical protein [Candidatus Aenigmarchaeota archaeon]MCK5176917.1 hypothetical protein [Candidatus Aenigmarchaeota archaeon]
MELPDFNKAAYFTKRTLDDRGGGITGEIILWRMKGEKEFKYILDCPFCKEHSECESIEFEKKPYKFRCPACDKIIRIGKLKEALKKRRAIEKKKAAEAAK